MYKLLCFTDSKSCEYDFLSHIETLAKTNIYALVLREKNLSSDDYRYLAKQVINICDKYGKLCILHNFIDAALSLNHKAVHLPLPVMRENKEKLCRFDIVGASTHSIQQAKEAYSLGAAYITYGHIFNTDCKKGLPPKGIETVKDIASNVPIPVYPLGGINADNIAKVKAIPTDGCAVMSGLMKNGYKKIIENAIR